MRSTQTDRQTDRRTDRQTSLFYYYYRLGPNGPSPPPVGRVLPHRCLLAFQRNPIFYTWSGSQDILELKTPFFGYSNIFEDEKCIVLNLLINYSLPH